MNFTKQIFLRFPKFLQMDIKVHLSFEFYKGLYLFIRWYHKKNQNLTIKDTRISSTKEVYTYTYLAACLSVQALRV